MATLLYHAVPAALPYQLCLLYTERIDPATILVPQAVTDSDCCPRNLTLWLIVVTANDLSLRYNPQHLAASSIRRNLTRAARWRTRNGVLTSTIRNGRVYNYGQALTNAIAWYSDEQFFFGVTGVIDRQTWTMQSPLDRDPQGPVIGPATAVYPLPIPQDLPAGIRAALLARNRAPPPFMNWLGQNFDITVRYYPQHVATLFPFVIWPGIPPPPGPPPGPQQGQQGPPQGPQSNPANNQPYGAPTTHTTTGATASGSGTNRGGAQPILGSSAPSGPEESEDEDDGNGDGDDRGDIRRRHELLFNSSDDE